MSIQEALVKISKDHLEWDEHKYNKVYGPYGNYFEKKEYFNVFKKLTILVTQLNQSEDFVRLVSTKLSILFGNYDAAVSYLKKIENSFTDVTALCAYVARTQVPILEKCSMPLWHALAKKHMPSETYERIFVFADKIEQYANDHAEKTKSNTINNITAQYKNKFAKKWQEIANSVQGITSHQYVMQHLSRMSLRIQKELNLILTNDMAKKYKLNLKSLSDKDKLRIRQYRLSREGSGQNAGMKQELQDRYRRKLAYEYKEKITIVTEGQEKYIASQLMRIKKTLKRSHERVEKDVLSENTDLNILINYATRIEYNCSEKQIDSAVLAFRHKVDKGLYNQFWTLQPKDDDHNIPPVKIDGKIIGYPDVILEKLSPFDPIAGVLGELTSCCQSFGKEGEMAAIHGITSPFGGFYVVRLKKTNDIIAQCWAWRGKKNGIVFDSIESQVQYRTDKQEMIAICFAYLASVLVEKYDVPVVLVGDGGKTSACLKMTYTAEPEELIDYDVEFYRDSEVQFVLCQSGALCNVYTALLALRALNENDLVKFKGCLDQGVNLNFILEMTVRMNRPSALQLLLHFGVDVNVAVKRKSTPIEIASQYRHWACVRILLREKFPNHMKDAISYSLYCAAKDDQFEIIELLLSAGADPNLYNALHWLLRKTDSPKMVEVLLNAGADINKKDQVNQTAIEVAQRYSRLQSLTILQNYSLLAINKQQEPVPIKEPIVGPIGVVEKIKPETQISAVIKSNLLSKSIFSAAPVECASALEDKNTVEQSYWPSQCLIH